MSHVSSRQVYTQCQEAGHCYHDGAPHTLVQFSTHSCLKRAKVVHPYFLWRQVCLSVQLLAYSQNGNCICFETNLTNHTAIPNVVWWIALLPKLPQVISAPSLPGSIAKSQQGDVSSVTWRNVKGCLGEIVENRTAQPPGIGTLAERISFFLHAWFALL